MTLPARFVLCVGDKFARMVVCGSVTEEFERICSARVSIAVPVLQAVDEYAEHTLPKLNALENLILDPMALEGFLSDQNAGDRGTRETVVDQPLDASFAFGLGFLPQ